jgi:hypothetical protein
MTKLQYTGSMQPMTWTGPVTYLSYRFGVGKTTGWVDNRDVGERGKSGMLNLKDNSGHYIFVLAQVEPQPVATEPVATEPVGTAVEPQNSGQEPDATVQNEETVVALAEPALEDQESELVAVEEEPSTPKSQVDFPDPSNLTVTEIRALKLTKEQWDALYRAELAGLNRKGVRDHVEGILASWVE